MNFVLTGAGREQFDPRADGTIGRFIPGLHSRVSCQGFVARIA